MRVTDFQFMHYFSYLWKSKIQTSSMTLLVPITLCISQTSSHPVALEQFSNCFWFFTTPPPLLVVWRRLWRWYLLLLLLRLLALVTTFLLPLRSYGEKHPATDWKLERKFIDQAKTFNTTDTLTKDCVNPSGKGRTPVLLESSGPTTSSSSHVTQSRWSARCKWDNVTAAARVFGRKLHRALEKDESVEKSLFGAKSVTNPSCFRLPGRKVKKIRENH